MNELLEMLERDKVRSRNRKKKVSTLNCYGTSDKILLAAEAHSDRMKKFWSEGRYDNRPLHSEDTKRKIGEANRGIKRSPEQNKAYSMLMKERWAEGVYSNQSEMTKESWKDPIWKMETLKAQNEGRIFGGPNGLEQDMINLLKRNNLNYKYVGNMEVIIGGKNPDFIHSFGKKICIEVRVEYFNKFDKYQDYSKERPEHFKKFGWICIIFILKRHLREIEESVIVDKIRRVEEEKEH